MKITIKTRLSSWIGLQIMWLKYAYFSRGSSSIDFQSKIESLSVFDDSTKPIAVIWVSNYDENSQLSDNYAMAEYYGYREALKAYYNVQFILSSGDFAKDMWIHCYGSFEGKKASLCIFSAIANEKGILVRDADNAPKVLERWSLVNGINRYISEKAQLLFMVSNYLSCQYHQSNFAHEVILNQLKTQDMYGTREVLATEGKINKGTSIVVGAGENKIAKVSFAK